MVAIIAAVAENNVIGNAGELPWYIPEDLKHFREITTGHVVIMGRKTWESILARLGKPLPGRTCVVLTKQVAYEVPKGVSVFTNLEEALVKYSEKNLFIIGGAQLYAEGVGFADVLYITRVQGAPVGDTYFPDIDWSGWKLETQEPHEGYVFCRYVRV